MNTFDRIPPQNPDAERSVLGAILINPLAMDTAVEVLGSRPEDTFYVEAHQHIFRAMLSLTRGSQPVDATTVLEQLTNDGHLDAAGGVSYLGELTGAVPTSANIAHYAKIVEEKAAARRLISGCTSVIAAAYDGDVGAKELLDQAEAVVLGLHNQQHSGGPVRISEGLEEVLNDIQALKDHQGQTPGMSTGIPLLDRSLGGWQCSDLVILAARTSVGKTAFALFAAHHAAMVEEAPVLILSLEMDLRQNVQRLLCVDKGVSLERIRTGFQVEAEIEKARLAATALSQTPIYVDDSPTMSLFEARSKARRFFTKHGPGLLIVDYLQLMTSGQRADKRYLEVAQISRGLKALARELRVPVMALCQLSRAADQDGGRPRLFHLRESGSLEQDADQVLFLSRPWKARKDILAKRGYSEAAIRNLLTITVAKNRNGAKDVMEVLFERDTQRFLPLAHPSEAAGAPAQKPEDGYEDENGQQAEIPY
jgi:replicative DNA helicase